MTMDTKNAAALMGGPVKPKKKKVEPMPAMKQPKMTTVENKLPPRVKHRNGFRGMK